MTKIEVLKQHFGHESFRPLQERAVDAILQGRDLLMILPTGGGKSLCYQLPTLMMPGVTLVVSPLLALMHDQVTALREQGIAAAMLGSMQSMEEQRDTLDRLRRGELKLLYVAPERLANEYFSRLLETLPINFFVIDEAHCVSEWGHEFRLDYRRLSMLRERFERIPIAAFTATATMEVEQDIAEQLGLRDPLRVRGSLYRKNLTVSARHRLGDGRGQLLELLAAHRGESGIVYTLSRKQTESLAEFLKNKGHKAAAFHAGLEAQEKRRVYEAFLDDEIETVVATVAFGMGIDKSNIRYVAHMSLPKSVENYYQEIGRAGRDGLEAETLLLFGAQDLLMQRRFIDALPESAYKAHAYDKLQALWRLCAGELCRHKALAAYFSEDLDECGTRCDNCLIPSSEQLEITEAARKFLSAAWRSGQRFGTGYLIDLLRGSRDRRILANGHETLSVYGIGKDLDRKQWGVVADRLLELGATTLNEHKGVLLTSRGAEILKGHETVAIRRERMETKTPSRSSFAESDMHEDFDRELFERLRTLRKEIAKEHGIPPYVVFSDKTLRELALHRPTDREEMLAIHGIGQVKFERYGEEFLLLLKE
ncbi:DNA helicase RecQ [Nitratifractor sp.]